MTRRSDHCPHWFEGILEPLHQPSGLAVSQTGCEGRELAEISEQRLFFCRQRRDIA